MVKLTSKQRLKLVGYFVVAILVLNVVLFSFLLINWIVFWVVIILAAIFVWKGLPLLRKKFN